MPYGTKCALHSRLIRWWIFKNAAPPVEVTEFSKDGNLRGMPVSITSSQSALSVLFLFLVNLNIPHHPYCPNSSVPQDGNKNEE